MAGCKSGQRVLNLTQMAVSLGTDITSRRLCPVCMRLQDVIARVLSLDGEKDHHRKISESPASQCGLILYS